MLKVVETTSANGRHLSQTISLQPEEQSLNDKSSPASGPAAGVVDGDGHPSVAFSATVEPPRRGPCIFTLQTGQFETCTMPENVEQLWGPVALPSLPDGVPNTCIVASHRCACCVRVHTRAAEMRKVKLKLMRKIGAWEATRSDFLSPAPAAEKLCFWVVLP